MSDIRDRLAKATTEEEEREALLDAITEVWGRVGANAVRHEADTILNGPRAGWLGVPLLAMPEGAVWCVMTDYEMPGRARIQTDTNSLGKWAPPTNFEADAETPACALMLAVLAAREVKQ